MIDYDDVDSINSIIKQITRLTHEIKELKIVHEKALKISGDLQKHKTGLEHDLDVMYFKFKEWINNER